MIDDGLLRGATPHLTRLLEASLASGIAVTKGQALTVRDSEFALPRAGKRPLQVAVTPVSWRNQHVDGSARAAAMLFVVDPDVVVLPEADLLQQRFALTRAEARVAVALASAKNVSDIADELSVSRETVRSHVKHVLGKAGVRTQGQFVHLVAAASFTVATLQPRGN